ncbi:hypothetical protein D9M69_627810 [compost metagenome]
MQRLADNVVLRQHARGGGRCGFCGRGGSGGRCRGDRSGCGLALGQLLLGQLRQDRRAGELLLVVLEADAFVVVLQVNLNGVDFSTAQFAFDLRVGHS